MSACSPLLAGVLNSNWKVYEKHITEVKIKQSVVACCLCCQTYRLDTDEHHSLKTVVCECSHPLCADCYVESDVFTPIKYLRHRIPPKDRMKYSFGFYCDGCGASNKVTPQLQPKDTNSSTAEPFRQLRPRQSAKEFYVDFTWRRCRWCEQRCHTKCLLYRIKIWEPAEAPIKSPKRARREFDDHTRNVKARAAKGPTSPLALFASTPTDPPSEDDLSSSSERTTYSPTLEDLETLEYGM